DRGEVGHMDFEGHDRAADFLCSPLGERLVAVPDRDACAGSDKAFGDRAPKPLRTASYYGAAAVQINLVHRRFLGPNQIVLAVIPGWSKGPDPESISFDILLAPWILSCAIA